MAEPVGVSSTRRAVTARAAAEAAAPSTSRAPPPPRQSSPSSSSGIMKVLKSIFSVCTSNAVETWENKRRIRKHVRRFKTEMRSQGREVSPDGSECEDMGAPPTFEDPFAGYVNGPLVWHVSRILHHRMEELVAVETQLSSPMTTRRTRTTRSEHFSSRKWNEKGC